MLVKALVSFAGKLSMYEGEIKEVEDGYVVQDLLRAKYIEPVKVEAKPEVKPKAKPEAKPEKKTEKKTRKRSKKK